MQLTDRHPVWQFFNERLGLHFSDDFRGVCHVPDEHIGRPMRMDHVAVGIGYNGFIGRTCCIHIVIQRPEMFTRRVLREALEYPFIACDCAAVLALVDSANDASLAFTRRIGFKEIASVPGGGLDGDLVVLRMLRGECRWIRQH